jgi:glycosyltransferase involved in cell wall biosynthesis
VSTNDPTVLHVIAARGIGGAEHMLSALVTAKRDNPLSQVVVNLMADPELAAVIRASGVPVYELDLRNVVQVPLVLMRLVKLIRTLRPAAIQSWLYYSDLLSLWALKLSGRRIITHLYWGIRCSDMDLSKYRASLRWTVAACAKRSQEPDAVIANSFAGVSAHRHLGYTSPQFAVIPNGIDCGRFKPDTLARARLRTELGIPEADPVVIHVARVDPMKDHASMIAVARALPKVTFIAVGQGTNALAVPSNVIALGARRDVASLYPAADIALSTSMYGEGFPNVVAEAMACGVPVVATDVGDSSRIVADVGLLVPPGDVAAMTAAIHHLLDESRPLRAKREIACRMHIKYNFSLARAVTAFDALYFHGTLPSS